MGRPSSRHEGVRPYPRPNKTGYHAFGPKIELLTRDGILPFGYELLAGLEDDATINPERILSAIQEISHAMGSQGMVEGRYKEMIDLYGIRW
ncbi:hypothetical protein IFM89_022189 [Coptis chinensis]|uniref:Uncharacterized protein n=1 Tax=Coptis chinensis TaxID=261450 RepID=A0A835LJ58_9MAGN|nr:hypothetical protein IFM89_022189 [Coptis chinensis]